MTPESNWRGLCEELLDEVLARPLILDRTLIDRARAALAQPEPEVAGPSDGPAVPEGREPASVVGEPSDEELLELYDWMLNEWAANHDFELPPSQFARAVLARWGRPAPAPAGERQAAPVPVAVSERLPGPRDCAPWPNESDASAQRLLDEFHEGATKWDGGFSIRHGLAQVLLHIKATEQDAESFYAIPQDRLESLVDELTAPSLLEQAMLGDRVAARRFLHEAGFTDADGNWLPQYQPLPTTEAQP